MNISFGDHFKNKTVLITGDSGFKGSWLAIWLVKLGAKVIGYSLPPKGEQDNFTVCGLNKIITHVDGDVRDYNSLSGVFSKYKPDISFHLAAQALVLDSYQDPRYTFDTNVMGTVNFFEAVRNTPSVKCAINVTSDKCYDNREWIYGYREIDPLGGKDPYSASKGASEIVTASYLHSFFQKEAAASVASVRAGNVIGGGDWAKNRIFPDCMRSLAKGEPIVLRNPDSVRPWQHVLEPLGGYLKLAFMLETVGKNYCGAWNFGPDYKNMQPVKSLVEKTIKKYGKGNYICENNGGKLHEANLLYLDVSKAANLLGWRSLLDLDEVVSFSVEEYDVAEMKPEEVFAQRTAHIEKYVENACKKGDARI